MQSRASDHETKPEDHDPSDPPGAVSNQNQEQAEGGHADEGADGFAIRREYRPSGRTRGEEGRGGGAPPAGDKDPDPGSDDRPGAASEGSQATGNPQNAG